MHPSLENRGFSLPFLVLLLLLAAGLVAAPVHAADDSNSGQLTPAPTVNPQDLNSALSALSQGTNDTAVQQLVSQLQSQLGSGNYGSAASTLVQLQGLSADNKDVPPSLKALLQSLAVGNNGASINANTLASLLQNSSNGASRSSQQRLSVDMQTLANLMQYVNSTMASQLLQNSAMLSQNAFAGSSGVKPGGSQIGLPGVPSSIPSLAIPPVNAPSVSLGGGAGGPPSLPLVAIAIPVIVVVAAVALFLSRGQVARIVGTQRLPDLAFLRGGRDEGEGDESSIPSDPRKRIEFYFGRAVRLMSRRGVPKLNSETHREFSSKCEPTPERPQISAISSLYEKAKFSGQGVENPEADSAAAALFAMGKDRR